MAEGGKHYMFTHIAFY